MRFKGSVEIKFKPLKKTKKRNTVLSLQSLLFRHITDNISLRKSHQICEHSQRNLANFESTESKNGIIF